MVTEKYFPRGGATKDGSSFKKKQKGEKLNFKHKTKQHTKIREKSSNEPGVEEDEDIEKLFSSVKEKLDFTEKGTNDPQYFSLRAKDLTKGVISLCTVNRIHYDKVFVVLPGQIRALVPIADISRPFTKIREDGDDFSLEKLVHIGQIVSCKVSSVNSQDNLYTVTVTTDPASVNSSLVFSTIQRESVLQMAIEAVEDHGYTLFSGIPGLTAFLPFEKAEYLHKLYSMERLAVGTLLWAKVYKSLLKETSNVVHCTAEPGPMSKPLSDEQIPSDLIPGMTVKVVVTQMKSGGAVVQVNSTDVQGGIEWSHLVKPSQNDDDSLFKKPEVGDCLVATVLFKFPLTSCYYFSCFDLSIVEPRNQKKVEGIFKKCKIIKWMPKGIYVELNLPDDEGVAMCFIPYNCLGRPDNKTYEEQYHAGKIIDCQVFSIDALNGVYIGQLHSEGSRIELTVGSLVKVVIEMHTKDGVVVSTSDSNVSGFVLWRHMTDTEIVNEQIIEVLKKKFPLHSTHSARVSRADEKLWLTLNPNILSNPNPTCIKDFKVGDSYYVKVLKEHKNDHYLVIVNEKFYGVIPEKPDSPLEKNQVVLGFVKKVASTIIFSWTPPETDGSSDVFVGNVVDVELLKLKDDGFEMKVDSRNGFVPMHHLDRDITPQDIKLPFKLKGKILKVKPLEVTMKTSLVEGNVPTCAKETAIGTVVTGLIRSAGPSLAIVDFAGYCSGMLYNTKNEDYKVHQEITCRVIDRETSCLVLGPKDGEVVPFRIGDKHSLTVTKVKKSGFYASVDTCDEFDKVVFIYKYQLDDFIDICDEKMQAIKKGEVLEDAVVMFVEDGVPLFTFKKSISSFIEGYRYIGQHDFRRAYDKKNQRTLKSIPNFIPCTVKNIVENKISINLPVRNIGTFEAICDESIEASELREHQTLLCRVQNYEFKTNTLKVTISPSFPIEKIKDWAIKRTQEYIEWIRETFTFGSPAEFYTERDDRIGTATIGENTFEAHMLGTRKITKYQKIPAVIVHKEMIDKQFVVFVVPHKKPLLRFKATDEDFDSCYVNEEVSAMVLYRSKSVEIASIVTPENMKGLLVYMPILHVNQVRPVISDTYVSKLTVQLIGLGKKYFIGIKPLTVEINKLESKVEKGKGIKRSADEELASNDDANIEESPKKKKIKSDREDADSQEDDTKNQKKLKKPKDEKSNTTFQIGSVVDVEALQFTNEGLSVQINGVSGLVPKYHLDSDHIGMALPSTLKGKVLKYRPYLVVTLKKELVEGEVPSSWEDCSVGSIVKGLVTKSTKHEKGVAFAGNCFGVMYDWPSNKEYEHHQVITCKVIDKETNCLILGSRKSKIRPFRIGDRHSLTVTKTSVDGFFASITLPDGLDRDFFISKYQLDDFEDICEEKIKAINRGDVLKDAVVMSIHNDVPLFTFKNSLSKFLKEYGNIGRSDVCVKLQNVYDSGQFRTLPNFIPCTVQEIVGDAVSVAVPIRNISNYDLIVHKSIDMKQLKVHRTLLMFLGKYYRSRNALELVLTTVIPTQVFKTWNLERIKEYVQWSRESFEFGQQGNFITDRDDRIGTITLNDQSFDAYMLGDNEITKSKKSSVAIIHRETKDNKVMFYVVKTKNSIIRISATEADYQIKQSVKKVKVNILHRNKSVAIGVVVSPEKMKGLIIYLPTLNVNSVKEVHTELSETIYVTHIMSSGCNFLVGMTEEPTGDKTESTPLKGIKRIADTDKSVCEDSPVAKKIKSKELESVPDETPKESKKKKKSKVSKQKEEDADPSEATESSLMNEPSPPRERKKTDAKGSEEDTMEESVENVDTKKSSSKKRKVSESEHEEGGNTPKAQYAHIEDLPEFIKKKFESLVDDDPLEDSFIWDPKPEDLVKVISGGSIAPAPEDNDDGDDSDEEIKPKGPISKKERKKRQEERERKLREKEEELLNAMEEPKSTEHFERLALARPGDSKMWIKYMAFHLQATEIEKGRAIAKRALNLIPPREEQDRLNVWIALLNLDYFYSTREEFKETLAEALRSNDDLKVNYKVLDLHAEAKCTSDLEHHVNNMVKKYKDNAEAWYKCLAALMKADLAEKARLLLQRALKSLIPKEHVTLICRFALLENSLGNEEEAQTLLDNVLTSYPQRTDVWSVYTNMLIKSERYDLARQIFERATSSKMPVKKMKVIFTKWIEFETKHGTKKNLEHAKKSASDYVNNFKIPVST